MNEELIRRHNGRVGTNDSVVHAGDFSLGRREETEGVIRRLNGHHVFLQGSHDYWARGKKLPFLWEWTVDDLQIVVCHYPMLSWPRSYHGSWLLHGHTHGRLKAYPGILDVGVDNWDFYPVDFDEVRRHLWR